MIFYRISSSFSDNYQNLLKDVALKTKLLILKKTYNLSDGWKYGLSLQGLNHLKIDQKVKDSKRKLPFVALVIKNHAHLIVIFKDNPVNSQKTLRKIFSFKLGLLIKLVLTHRVQKFKKKVELRQVQIFVLSFQYLKLVPCFNFTEQAHKGLY